VTTRLLAFLTALAALAGTLASATGVEAQTDRPADLLRLQAGAFRPAAGETLDLPPGLTIAGQAGTRGYGIVQFDGPVTETAKAAVTATGAELLHYLPDFAFKARMTPAQMDAVEAIDEVAWVGVFQPAYKLSGDIATATDGLYRVQIERGANAGLATAAVVSTGATVITRSDTTLMVATDSVDQLTALANVVDVAWISPFRFNEKHNEVAGGIIMGADQAIAGGYDGSSQIAAVSDTGLGDGTAGGAHPDIPAGRIAAIFDWTAPDARRCYDVLGDGPRDVDSGHGTHVSVSVLGDGGQGGIGRGVAPAARLVFQATEDYLDTYARCNSSPDGYYLIGLPDDLNDLYRQAYEAGARIHSNSWGSDVAGQYTQDSADTDDFVFDNPDMTVTFSAGNDGVDANQDGRIDADSTGSPATAKNVITVGASENARPDDWPCDPGLSYPSRDDYQLDLTCQGDMGGTNVLGSWGERYGMTAEPLASDATAGNAEQMAGWSSRGPTDDGRIKPDVVAPGTWILSGYSGLYQEHYDSGPNPRNGAFQWDGWGLPFDQSYKYMGGTSMSNPLAAGAATVVRDFYQKAESHQASAALTKATLINSAVDLADENNDGADDNDFPIPNVHEGWGRVDVAAATDGSHRWVDDGTGVATGDTADHAFSVAAAGAPLKVTLVWSDAASTPTAGVNLVNDLDLVVTAPDGTVHRGNVFSGGWTLPGGSADRVNNVENVYLSSAAAGTWTVDVVGHNVPVGGTQPFALVVDGDLGGEVDTPPAVDLVAPADGATVAGTVGVTIGVSDEDAPGALTVEWRLDDEATWRPTSWNGSAHTAVWDTTATGDGGQTIEARATDSRGQTGTDAVTVTVANTGPPPIHVGDLDGSSSAGRGNRWNATVTVTVHGADEEPVSGANVSGSWSGGTSGSGSCSTDGSGRCTITRNNIRNAASVTFGVDGVTATGAGYDADANHDPDGDSDGTTVVVLQP
jgi:hypothetical protein